MRPALWLAALGLLALLPALSRSDSTTPLSRRPLPSIRLNGAPPSIDGDLADPAWQSASKAEGFTDRQTGKPAPDQTVAFLLYDDRYLYLAFDCRDSQPEGIVGRETLRDSRYQRGGGSGSEDWVEILFDPYLSFKWEDLARFSVNALGTRSARITGGRAGKAEWSGDWEAVAKRTATGWCAEMRIPWSTLNYPSNRKQLTMGLNFVRFQYRTRIESEWSFTGPQQFSEHQGLWEDVAAPRGAFRPTLSLLPYFLPSAAPGRSQERSGVDARYTLSPDISLVGSVNPDFATIEGAVQSIAFTRAEQFLPERRPFFLEGNGFFNAGGFGIGPLFYSNRIPTFDIGAKAFGKLTPTDTFGVLSAIDFGRRSDLIARYRRDLNPTTQASIFLSHKDAIPTVEEPKGDHNSVAALAAGTRRGKLGIDLQTMASDGTDAGGRAGLFGLFYLDGNYFTSVRYSAVAPTFRASNGLIFFSDLKGFQGYHGWGRQWRGNGAWRSVDVSVRPQYTWHYDGRPFQRGADFQAVWETRSDYGIGFNVSHSRFDDQTDRTLGFFLGAGQSNRFRRAGLSYQVGMQANQPYRYFGPSFSLRTLKKLDLLYSGSIQQQAGWSRQHVLTMNYEISPTRSLGGRMVALQSPDATLRGTNYYLSYRNAGEAGMETYFILGDPNALQFTRRAAVKLVFAM